MKEGWIDFKEVKSRVSMSQVIERYQLQLKRVNANYYRGDCPLKTHSSPAKNTFSVNAEKNVWSCQSDSCVSARGGKKGGNVLDFVRFREGVSLKEAGTLLLSWFGVSSSPQTAEVVAEQVVETPPVEKKRYMQEAEEWLRGILKRSEGESEEVWESRVVKAVKTKLLASYWNGVNVGKGLPQETNSPIPK